jgi:hypothetical protein
MALEMRSTCERCGRALARDAEANICIYECTFCPDCTAAMSAACPNCGGELVRRPRASVDGVEAQCGPACAAVNAEQAEVRTLVSEHADIS